MKLILVRHGETKGNEEGIIVSHNPGRLTERGLKQVKLLGSRLKDEKIDVIISSDLRRARQTAKQIARSHDVDVEYRKDVRERDAGVFTGKPKKDFYEAVNESGFSKARFKPEKGESMVDVRDRAKKFLKNLKAKYGSKTVLVSSHGGFIKMFLSVVLGKTAEEGLKLNQENTGVNVIVFKDGQVKVREINSLKHLEKIKH